ncbi:MAG: hypothetical protein ACFFC7_22730 [Candidatus Hermodarchaeota archaeon]
MAMSQNEHFLFMQSVLQFLKNNEFRIAVHTYSRSGSPLSSRDDLKSFCEGVNESKNLDILALDSNSKIVVLKCFYDEELILHLDQDLEFTNSLNAAIELGLPEGSQLWFVSNGIISEKLVTQELPDHPKVEFVEARLTSRMHKLTNPKIYLRKVISAVRRLPSGSNYEPSDHTCECGTRFLKGTGIYSYWGKELALEYYICPSCGVQGEDDDNSAKLMNFISGIK